MNRFTIEEIDPQTLTGVARCALRSDTVEIGDWQHAPLSRRHIAPGRALHRFSGDGTDRGKPVRWSVVLKLIHRPGGPGADDPTSSNYWKREVQAYQSGLLDDLPAGLVAARCLGITEPQADTVCLWLEEVTDPFGPEWAPERCLLAARHLGRFNGAYLAGRPLPSFPWLSRGWLRSWVEGVCAPSFAVLEQPGLWDHPLVAPAFSPSAAARLQHLCAQREQLLEALDQRPQTLCHWDAWRPNLFGRWSAEGQDETGAVDWAFMGSGAVGTEVGQLVAMDLLEGHVSPAGVGEFAAQAIDSYTAGLREAGWRGDQPAVEFGAAALIALRWGLVLPGYLRGVLEESVRARIETMLGTPLAAALQRWGAASDFLLDQAGVALQQVE